jgi:hypothetical protein
MKGTAPHMVLGMSMALDISEYRTPRARKDTSASEIKNVSAEIN